MIAYASATPVVKITLSVVDGECWGVAVHADGESMTVMKSDRIGLRTVVRNMLRDWPEAKLFDYLDPDPKEATA